MWKLASPKSAGLAGSLETQRGFIVAAQVHRQACCQNSLFRERSVWQAHHFEHLFSWLLLTQAQLQSTPGFSPARGLALWHRFNLVREQPFIHWMMALGAPLPQASLKALGDMSWQQMRERSAKAWQALPGTGEERTRQIVSWINAPEIDVLVRWLARQHINGF